MKKILGLDLGTNSIGWALIEKENKKILGMNSRIIPMGSDKIDYEKGIGITKNAIRREKRTARKMNKRYKLRRNKLLYILNELGMLPDQFQFKNGIPEPNKIQNLELLPIKKGTLQLDSIQNYELRASAISHPVKDIKDFGKILYQFNQLRGYAGGNNDDDKKKVEKDDDENDEKKKFEVITQKVEIVSVEKSENTFKLKKKGSTEEQFYFDLTVLLDGEEIEGVTKLQNLEEKKGKEEEFELRIKRTKNGETIEFALPQKTNWRKQMEETEKLLSENNLHVSELIIKDLQQNKWTKIRNRVVLRNRYEKEFDAIWNTQALKYTLLNDCPKEVLSKIANYIFPGTSQTQEQLRKDAVERRLKHIIKNQVIYYQRPLKPQTELIGKCRFEKEEQVIANTHPLFQEFRCWDQINRMFVTFKAEVYNAKKKKNVFQYSDRFLTNKEKLTIYEKLQTQKQVGFNEVAKIAGLKSDKTEYLNGLNVKAKLKGCDTIISIKKVLGNNYDLLIEKDSEIIEKIWKVVFDNVNNGSEYDPNSIRVSSVLFILKNHLAKEEAIKLALEIAKKLKFPRKYASLSIKAILNILPLMQLNPSFVSEKVKKNFLDIQHLIETGEILNENLLEDYVINYVDQNPDLLEKGGLMYAFASSLVYGKHTKQTINAQISNYHDIKYIERNLRNPLVEQIVNETMQVVKAIWKEYKFNTKELEIRVELARDLKNSAAERDKIFKGQLKNQKQNVEIKNRLQEAKISITDENILKYKLYSQQKYISPYSGETLQLSEFDTYQIDHIIPKSRFFDDSISNKVLVEGFLNSEKGNRTAWEYMTQQTSKHKISSIEKYINHVNDLFYGKKKKNLLLEKIPSNPVERLIKDTQYISIAVKNELAKIVGSDNVKTSTGEVTSFLRSRWGLKKLFMELTEKRFREMELWDWNKKIDQPNSQWVQKYYDKEKQKHIYEIKNWSKRYDHRHHAIDALTVALTEQSHIQRLNNLNKYLQEELSKRKDEFKLEVKEDENILEAFFNLEATRREEIQKQIESSRHFETPFKDLIKQAQAHLEAMTVSIKPKDKLVISIDKPDNNTPHKHLKRQVKIKGALHQETIYGKTKDTTTGLLRDTKTIELSKLTAKDIPQIVDKVLREDEIPNHKKKYESIKEAFTDEGLKIFNESRFQKKNPDKLKPPVYKVKVWYSKKEDEENSLQRLYDNNNKLSVITGDNYLFLVLGKGEKRIFDIASLYDSADIAKRALKENDEKFKQRICEDFRIKHKDNPDKVLFTLQQGDLVYFPENTDDPILNFDKIELKKWLSIPDNKIKFNQRIYKVTKFTGKDCYFIPHNYANVISVSKDLLEEQIAVLKETYKDKKIPKMELNFVEYGSYRDCSPYEAGEAFVKNLTETDKKQKPKLTKIQETCIKIQVDWLGYISRV